MPFWKKKGLHPKQNIDSSITETPEQREERLKKLAEVNKVSSQAMKTIEEKKHTNSPKQ